MTAITNGEVTKVDPQVMSYILMQLLLKQELSEWKECSEEAITKELTQLHFHNTF